MNFLQSILIYFIKPVLSLLVFLIFIEVIFSWLVAFNVINLRNPMMQQIYMTVRAIVQPILNPIRRVIPAIGGLDLSPIVALLGLSWLGNYVVPSLFHALG